MSAFFVCFFFTRKLRKAPSLDNKKRRAIEGHELQEVTDRVEEIAPQELETTVGKREI